jgi:hypothetical protein
MALSRGMVLGPVVASIGAEQRRISQRSVSDVERYVYGWAVTASASSWIGATNVSARAGLARHPAVRDIIFGGATLSRDLGRVRFVVDASSGPAYAALMTTQALLSWRGGEIRSTRPLIARTVLASVSAALGRAEVGVAADHWRLNDRNRRTGATVTVRHPVRAGFSLLYAGGALGWSDRSDVYWDPDRYTYHMAGIEYARRLSNGLGIAVRATPGVGRERSVEGGVPLRSDRIFQLSTSGELSYRRGNVDIAAGAAHGRGREGGYQWLNGSLRLRVVW